MDNNLSSMLYALNTYHQSTKIDQDSLLAGNIKVYSNSNNDANVALTNALNLLTAAYPNSNQYQLLDVSFGAGDASTCWVFITIRVK